jgi:hypothetical protein
MLHVAVESSIAMQQCSGAALLCTQQCNQLIFKLGVTVDSSQSTVGVRGVSSCQQLVREARELLQ